LDGGAPSRHGGASTVLPCKCTRPALLHQTTERRNGEEGGRSDGGVDGNPGDEHFFLNSLVKPFEIYSWKVLQKRLALLIKAFIFF